LAIIPNENIITITGGTVIDHGGDTTLKVNFTDLTYESASTAINLAGTMTNTIMTGIDSITVGTLSTTASDTLTLNGAAITNAAGKDKVDFSVLGNTGSINELILNGAQSTKGFTITLNQAELGLTGGVDLSHAKLIVPSGTSGWTNMLNADSSGDTLGTGFVLTQQANSDLAIVGGASAAPLLNQGTLKIAGFTSLGNNTDGLAADGYLANAGRIDVSSGGTFAMGEGNSGGSDYGYLTNSGTISVSHGYLQLDVSNLVNTGLISVSHGTLALGGSLTVPSLTEFSDPHSQLIVNGVLDLGSASATLGSASVPVFSLAAGPTSSLGNSAGISDGTFVVTTGATFDTSGNYLDITVNLVNDGTYAYSGGSGNEQTITGAVSGSGEIALDSAQIALAIGGAVASGQTIAFLSTDQTLSLQTATAQSSFDGTLSGFAAGDSIAIVRQSASVSLTGGSFVGDSIVATLSTGATIALATSSALSGSFTIDDNSQTGTDTLTYAGPAARDWALPHPDQAFDRGELVGAFRPSEQGLIDFFLPLHAL